ncbi:hypothetical protein DMW20_11835 [Vibrio parahaemolyticus]|nr:hypothetical protein [Vibrio parahaemolyticus]
MSNIELKSPMGAIHKFVKRLEKAKIISGKVKDANYRKVRILQKRDGREIKVIFNILNDRDCEMSIDIDVVSVTLNTAEYLNETFHEIIKAAKIFKEQNEEAFNAKYSDA